MPAFGFLFWRLDEFQSDHHIRCQDCRFSLDIGLAFFPRGLGASHASLFHAQTAFSFTLLPTTFSQRSRAREVTPILTSTISLSRASTATVSNKDAEILVSTAAPFGRTPLTAISGVRLRALTRRAPSEPLEHRSYL